MNATVEPNGDTDELCSLPECPYCDQFGMRANDISYVGYFVTTTKKTDDDSETEKPLNTKIDRMLYLNGSKTSFRCECGANVFREYEQGRYRCNGCRATHTGEKND